MRTEWKDDQLFLQIIFICGGAVSLRYRCVLCGKVQSGLLTYGFSAAFFNAAVMLSRAAGKLTFLRLLFF